MSTSNIATWAEIARRSQLQNEQARNRERQYDKVPTVTTRYNYENLKREVPMQWAAMLIQSQARMRQGKQQYQGEINAATILQSVARKLRTQAELKAQRDAAAIINKNLRTVVPKAELKVLKDAKAQRAAEAQRDAEALREAEALRAAEAIDRGNIASVVEQISINKDLLFPSGIDFVLATQESKDFRKWLVAFNQVLTGSRSELTKAQWNSILTKKKDQYTGPLVGGKKWGNCLGHSGGWRTKSENSYNSTKDNIERLFPEDGVNL
jgi:hypothetical protein